MLVVAGAISDTSGQYSPALSTRRELPSNDLFEAPNGVAPSPVQTSPGGLLAGLSRVVGLGEGSCLLLVAAMVHSSAAGLEQGSLTPATPCASETRYHYAFGCCQRRVSLAIGVYPRPYGRRRVAAGKATDRTR